MKIEHLIVQHLYNSKKVSLEDIGTFYLSPNVSFNGDDKDAVLPENAITFDYQPKAQRDDALVDFIVQHSRKIKPLATSDLESYSILGREYLNIGKPFIIEGLGVLQKTQFGTYEFAQGNTINPKLEAQAAHIKEKEDHVIDFSSPSRKNNSGKTGIAVLAIIILALTAAAIIYFLTREPKVPVNTSTENNSDSAQALIQIPLMDSVAVRDSIAKADSLRLADNTTFKVIIRKFPTKDAADKSLQKYTAAGYNFQLTESDSAFFILKGFYSPLSDTAKVKDSLSRLLGVKTAIF